MNLLDEAPVCARPAGLYCPAGDFYLDPQQPVARAVLTHAHGDHARPGSEHYWASAASGPILAHRLPEAACTLLDYGETCRLGAARISLHPAGHILGSAQVRIEVDDRVWVVSGDYKRQADPSCEPFEVVPCEGFITEATFALPVYRWPAPVEVVAQIIDWWQTNAAAGRASLLYCYSLGKAQRVLAELQAAGARGAALPVRPAYLHSALLTLTAIYRQAGISLWPTAPLNALAGDGAGELILAPPAAEKGNWRRRLARPATAMCSGWMRVRGNRRRRGYERGFVLSDHADWPALLQTVRETGARRVLTMHGQSTELAAFLQEQGLDAAPLAGHA